MVQGLLCPWWILRAYQGIMAGGSGGLDHKFCEGLKTLDGIAVSICFVLNFEAKHILPY